jgi:hypothetical protein
MSGAIKTRASTIFDFTITDTPLNLSSDDYNRLGIEAQISAGIKIPYGNGEFLSEVNYSRGLNDFTSDNFIVDAGIRNYGLSFSFGYGMRF